MKKTLLSLLLAMATVLICLFGMTACSEDEGGTNENRNFVTLSMWVIWEGHDNSSDKQKVEAAVEEAFNTISQETYSTKVVFKWFQNEEEYKTALAAKYEALKDVKPTDSNNKEEDQEPNSEYPALSDKQLDLVLMLDKDMYLEYASDGGLTQLDSLFSSTGRNLYNELSGIIQYVKTTSITVDSKTGKEVETTGYFAVPNLNTVGKYTYLLVNKKAVSAFKVGVDAADFTNISDCMELIYEVASYTGTDAYLNSLSPVLAPFDYYNAFFYTPYTDAQGNACGDTFDTTLLNGKNGLIATFWNAGAAFKSIHAGSLSNALERTDYMNYLALMNWCEENGAYASPDQDFAVGVIQGDYEDRNQYTDDYFCIVLDNPRMTDADLYSGMWAISKYTANASRAIEIISALETNQELLNTLVYGASSYYTTEKNGCVRSNGNYKMNARYCGNIYYVYPDLADGHDATWLAGRMVQKNEWLRDLWVDFGYQETLNQENMDQLQAMSNQVFHTLMALDPAGQSLLDYAKQFRSTAATLNTTVCQSATAAELWKNMVSSSAAVEFKGSETVTNKKTLSGNVKAWSDDLATKY